MTRPNERRKAQPPKTRPASGEENIGDHPAEQDPAVERGERIQTGKAIARGGKESGHVPGATEQE